MKDENYYIVSFSGGKDSTAMLLRLIEENRPIDEIIYVDTMVEYPEIGQHIESIKNYVTSLGYKFTLLKGEHDFEYYLLKIHIKESKKYPEHNGYGYPTWKARWCTNELKLKVIFNYINKIEYNVVEYIGFASDELERKVEDENRIYPLIDWGMTEKDCLEYCLNKGYTFGGLYDHVERVGCWCCPFSSKRSLKFVWKYHPELWAKLEEWDEQLQDRKVKFRYRFTVKEMAKKFKSEEEKKWWFE